ncbi:MAG: hypothetical protein KJ063_11095 [Anaerolineae bacterium]|nr:hypothetical protein [Anaerolineae bacterium]
MSESSIKPGRIEKVRGRVRRFIQNPVMIKELRSRMRGNRAFTILTLYLFGMVALINAIYLPLSYSIRTSGGGTAEQSILGKVIFGLIVLVQLVLVTFIAPAFTAGAISSEKQNQSFDLLRTTLLTPRQLIIGKLASALSYILLLILAAVPLQSLAFVLGGVAIWELLIAEMLIIVSAVAFALIGLFFSTIMRTTVGATVGTYAAALFLTIGIPFIMLLFSIIQSSFYGYRSSAAGQIINQYGLMALVSWNLPATLIMSEVTLLEHTSYWGFSTTVSVYASGVPVTIWLPSPWYIYLIWYTLLAVILYFVTIHRIARVPER